MSINRNMDKQIAVYFYNGMLLIKKGGCRGHAEMYLM